MEVRKSVKSGRKAVKVFELKAQLSFGLPGFTDFRTKIIIFALCYLTKCGSGRFLYWVHA
jgi:hypothetical protein